MRFLAALAAFSLTIGFTAPAAAQKRPVAAKAKPAAKPAPRRWVDMVARTPEGGYRQGNPNAAVKLIEYGARTCPTCAHFAAEAMAPLRTKYIASGKVSYEYRDYLVHGAPDLAAALVNQCVPTQRFFVVLDRMFVDQPAALERLHAIERDPARHHQLEALPPIEAGAAFADALGYVDFVKLQGVTEAKARACLANPHLVDGIIKVHRDGAERLKLRGTPSFLINGQVVAPYSWAELEPLLIAAIG